MTLTTWLKIAITLMGVMAILEIVRTTRRDPTPSPFMITHTIVPVDICRNTGSCDAWGVCAGHEPRRAHAVTLVGMNVVAADATHVFLDCAWEDAP
jgi:hypothetical protein